MKIHPWIFFLGIAILLFVPSDGNPARIPTVSLFNLKFPIKDLLIHILFLSLL